jgi:adenosylcobinamide kinase / adenosylcobinamide-phosphate guanylyltransferase
VSRIILVGGGVRCGKSRFALELARAEPAPRAFIATAEAADEEMRERARHHRLERADAFETLEVPLDLRGALTRLDTHVVVIDCITLWLSNLLLLGDRPQAILDQTEAVCAFLASRTRPCVLVTNEVGMGIVPETPVGRAFRDLAGAAHQRFARAASEVYLGALGLLLRLKPGPVASMKSAL